MTKDIEQLATKAALARNRAAQAFTRALVVLAKGESNAKVPAFTQVELDWLRDYRVP